MPTSNIPRKYEFTIEIIFLSISLRHDFYVYVSHSSLNAEFKKKMVQNILKKKKRRR